MLYFRKKETLNMNKTTNKRIHVTFTQEKLEELELLSKRLGMTKSATLTFLVNKELNSKKNYAYLREELKL